MTGYFVSLLMGLAVGVVYGLVQVRSPAPPLVALAGLLGMVLGEQAVDMATILRRQSRPRSSRPRVMSRDLASLALVEKAARAQARH
jgi:XapX domain-containing protein